MLAALTKQGLTKPQKQILGEFLVQYYSFVCEIMLRHAEERGLSFVPLGFKRRQNSGSGNTITIRPTTESVGIQRKGVEPFIFCELSITPRFGRTDMDARGEMGFVRWRRCSAG